MTLSWAHGSWGKPLLCYTVIIPEGQARSAYKGDGRAGVALPFPNWFPHLRPLLCFRKVEMVAWTAGETSKPIRKERKRRKTGPS